MAWLPQPSRIGLEPGKCVWIYMCGRLNMVVVCMSLVGGCDMCLCKVHVCVICVFLCLRRLSLCGCVFVQVYKHLCVCLCFCVQIVSAHLCVYVSTHVLACGCVHAGGVKHMLGVCERVSAYVLVAVWTRTAPVLYGEYVPGCLDRVDSGQRVRMGECQEGTGRGCRGTWPCWGPDRALPAIGLLPSCPFPGPAGAWFRCPPPPCVGSEEASHVECVWWPRARLGPVPPAGWPAGRGYLCEASTCLQPSHQLHALLSPWLGDSHRSCSCRLTQPALPGEPDFTPRHLGEV